MDEFNSHLLTVAANECQSGQDSNSEVCSRILQKTYHTLGALMLLVIMAKLLKQLAHA
jgi:hypothetical protein